MFASVAGTNEARAAGGLSISKSVSSVTNTEIVYSIVLTHTGDAAVREIEIFESLTGTLSCTWPIGNPNQLTNGAPNDTATCTFTYQFGVDEQCVDNTVYASGKTSGNAVVTSNVFELENQCRRSADYSLSVTKTLANGQSNTYTDSDQYIDYDIDITNTSTGSGDLTLTNFVISDSLSGDLSCDTTPALTDLDPNETLHCTFRYYLDDPGDYSDSTCITNTVDVNGSQNTHDDDEAPDVCYQPPPDGTYSLSVTKTVHDGATTYNDATGQIVYDITVTNNSSSGSPPITGISVTDFLPDPDEDVTASCIWPGNAGELGQGQSATCHFTYDVQNADLGDGKTITNKAKACGNVHNIEVCDDDSVTVGYVNVLDEITDTTNTFIMHRMDRLLTNEPKQPTLNQRAHGAGRSFQFSPSPMGYSINAFASLAAIRAANAAANGKAPGDTFDERFNAWIEMHGSTYNDTVMGTPDSGTFGVLYAGADWLINNGLMIGFLAQVDIANEKTADSMTGGTGWMAGPYLSAEVLPGVVLDLRGAWGQSSNSVTQDIMGTDWSGNFDTTRWLVRGKLSGTYQKDNWILTPSAAVAYIAEHKYAFMVSNGMGGMIAVPADDLALGRVTIGPELAYRSVQGNYISEPYGAVRLLWDFTASGQLSLGGFTSGGVRGALEGGLRVNHIGGWEMDLSAMYDGLGTPGFGAVSVQGSMRVPF